MVPDYYARLGVDPGADAAEIETALQQRRPVWSMATRNPKTRHTNQLYLDEIPALRRALLSDPASRAAYDAELAAAQITEREDKLDELQRRVRLRAAKGGLSSSDRALLRNEAVKLGLDEAVVNSLTRLIPSLTETPSGDNRLDLDADPPADVLAPSTRAQIRVALEHLGRRDLYDALDLFRDAPASVISARADEERQRWMKKAQVTAEKTAWLEVISHAQSHLTTPKARARYDRTLVLEAEEKFDAIAAFALDGLSRLDLGTRAALIEEAAGLGIGSERADRLIGRVCRRLGVSREMGAVSPLAAAGPPAGATPVNGAYQSLRCRGCAGVTEMSPVARRSGSARCRHCGASLKWDCPVCRRGHWVDQPRCDCGFRLALREPLVRHFQAALHAFRTHDLAAALEHLEQVQKYAPHHVGARNGVAAIRRRQADIERARSVYELAMAGGKLVAARGAVEAWRKLVDPASPEVQTAWMTVIRGLRQAEELAARARKLERGDPRAARSLYRQSLAIAADLPDALAGLNRCPPEPPSALEAQVLGDRIHLSWTPPPPDGLGPLSFAVVRKRGALPQHPGDGTRIAEVSTHEFDDRHVAPGEAVGYAVLSKRGPAESQAAVALGPLVFLADVQDVRIETREGEAELSWTSPRGVAEVRVVRKDGSPPADPRDGDRVVAALDRAVDRGLAPDRVYYYGIYAIYAMPDGRRFPAPGVVVPAWPRPPAPPLAAPRLVLAPTGEARLDWVEPERGTVRILRTSVPLPHPPGTRLSTAQAEALEGVWITLTGPDRAVDPLPPTTGVCYYTPLTAWGRDWTVGYSSPLSRVSDPTELRALRLGGTGAEGSDGVRVQLRWKWPQDADAVRIVARRGSPPAGPSDPEAVVVTVSREDYGRQGAWIVNLPAAPAQPAGDSPTPPAHPEGFRPSDGDHWHIRAYGVALIDGDALVSPGLDPAAATAVPGPHPEVTVSYVLKRPLLPWRSWSVVFRTEPAGAAIPPMVLVANARAVPLSVEDGEVIARFPAARDGAIHAFRAPPPLSRCGVRAFPDPTAEPGSLAPIRLRHPESAATRA